MPGSTLVILLPSDLVIPLLPSVLQGCIFLLGFSSVLMYSCNTGTHLGPHGSAVAATLLSEHEISPTVSRMVMLPK